MRDYNIVNKNMNTSGALYENKNVIAVQRFLQTHTHTKCSYLYEHFDWRAPRQMANRPSSIRKKIEFLSYSLKRMSAPLLVFSPWPTLNTAGSRSSDQFYIVRFIVINHYSEYNWGNNIVPCYLTGFLINVLVPTTYP